MTGAVQRRFEAMYEMWDVTVECSDDGHAVGDFGDGGGQQSAPPRSPQIAMAAVCRPSLWQS
jgi:hypothetical protein